MTSLVRAELLIDQDELSIPLKVMVGQNCGEVFAKDVSTHPSAFDSNRTVLKRIYAGWAPATEIVIVSTMMKYDVTLSCGADTFLIGQARRIVEALLAQGINEENTTELKRAAGVGPWPETVTENDVFTAMRGAYYVLVTLINEMEDREQAALAIDDLKYVLSAAWDGCYGWRI